MKLQPEDRQLGWALVFSFGVIGTSFLLSHFKAVWLDPIGSSLTIVAAFIGGFFIVHQIRSTEREARRKDDAKLMAARAAMPLALSSVTLYAIDCSESLNLIYASCTAMPVPRHVAGALPFPIFPFETISDFRTLIEFGPSALREQMTPLMAKIQVHRARLRDVERWLTPSTTPSLTILKFNIENYIVDVAEIYARTGALFDYARFRADFPRSIDADAIVRALDQLNYSVATAPDLYAKAEAWKPEF